MSIDGIWKTETKSMQVPNGDMRQILRRQDRRSESGDGTIQRRHERLIDAFERSILRKS
jgi:hypothetical protein